MKRLRIVFMGTPDFAVPCLDNLSQSGHDIAAVITQPDRPKGRGRQLAPSAIKNYALAHGLTVIQPEKVKDADTVAQIAALRPEVIVVVAFGQLLSTELLAIPPLGCINVHSSLLPKLRGAAPIHWAIMNGETVTGVTTMYMDRGMDTGDIILQSKLTIGATETTGQLHDRLSLLGAELLRETLSLVAAGEAPRYPQDKTMATYAPLLQRQIEAICWQRSAREIFNQIRGLNPWPGAYCSYNDKLLKVWKASIMDEIKQGEPGLVVAASSAGLVVQTCAGLLLLEEVQPQNKQRMQAGDFVAGYRVTSGARMQ